MSDPKVDLGDINRKADILARHASELYTRASSEIKQHYNDLVTALNRLSSEPAAYQVVYNIIVSKFTSNGQFTHEYGSGTIGDYLIGCSIFNGQMPKDVQACLQVCRQGVHPVDMPPCKYNVWEEREGRYVRTSDPTRGPNLVVIPGNRNLTPVEQQSLNQQGVKRA